MELTPENASEFAAACQAGAEEAASALGRALDGEFQLAVGEAASYASDAPPEDFDGPGLAVMFKFGEAGVVAVLPESSGLVPDWCAAPDATGESKLSTLAQELSMLLVPESLMADEFQAARLANISQALGDAAAADDAALVPLALAGGDKQGTLSLIWPVGKPNALFPVPEPAPAQAAESPPPEDPPAATASTGESGPGLNDLPSYARSLLKIEVPVAVCLATKKQSVEEIIELVPGSIIKFDKSCDELLELTVGELRIADGEPVKVGEKFGLQIHEMLLPDEQFDAVRVVRR